MNLVVFGDSWPNGAELKDHEIPFGKLLANRLNASEYIHCAVGGSSNDYTVMQLCRFVESMDKSKKHIAVFFLTDRSRKTLINNAGQTRNLKVPILAKESDDPIIKSWYMYFYNDRHADFDHYKNILSLQKICLEVGIQDYYITGWGSNSHNFAGIDQSKIYPQTCTELFNIPNDHGEFNMEKYASNKYISPNGSHPNQLGHQLIADTLYNWIINDNSTI